MNFGESRAASGEGQLTFARARQTFAYGHETPAKVKRSQTDN